MRKKWPIGLGVFIADRASKLAAQTLLPSMPSGSFALIPGVIHLTIRTEYRDRIQHIAAAVLDVGAADAGGACVGDAGDSALGAPKRLERDAALDAFGRGGLATVPIG